MATEKLTQARVNKLEPRERPYSVADGDVSGLQVIVTRKGHRSFRLQYYAHGQKRGLIIGDASKISLDAARKLAREAAQRVAQGHDPAAERRHGRESVTVAALVAEFLKAKMIEAKAKNTLRDYTLILEKYVVPALGTRHAASVARQDVQRIVSKLRERFPAQALKLSAVVSSLYAWGGKHYRELESVNPAKGVDKPKAREFVKKRATLLEDLDRIIAAVAELEATKKIDDRSAAAIQLLALTGCRLREVLSIKWEHVDFERGNLHLPQTKTGARVVALNSFALAILQKMERIGECVFPGDCLDRPRVDLKRPWRKVVTLAGVEGFRLHDLRHGFATIGAGSGAGLPLIGKLLGHTQAATTLRYADAHADPQRRLSEIIGAAIVDKRSGGSAGNVVTLPRKGLSN